MNTTCKFISLFIFIISTSIPARAFVIISTNQTENAQTYQTEETDEEIAAKTPEQIAQLKQQAIQARKGVDFCRVYLYSLVCFSASFYCKNQTIKLLLRRLAIIEPLARLIATRKFYYKLCNWLPFFGKHMQCTNESCPGICNHCKLKLIYKEVPLRLALMLSLNWVSNKITNHRVNNPFI